MDSKAPNSAESSRLASKPSKPSKGESEDKGRLAAGNATNDVFGDEEGNDIKYKTLSWQMVSVLMIAEIVSNGMLSLPSSGAVVGLVPNAVLIVVLGIFGTYTAWLLVQFKLNHPEVHNMGDAGQILFGRVGREILGAGTVIFAIFATGSQLLAGQVALAYLTDSKLCLVVYTVIFTAPTLLISFPRTLDKLSWLGVFSVGCILVVGIVAMVGAGVSPLPGRIVSYFPSTTFTTAFTAVTSPTFAFAGHFMFFIMISEMHTPRHAMRSAYVLQAFATTFYLLFSLITYYYIGNDVLSPSLSSLPPKWAKATYAIALPNFLIAGSLYSHTATKLIFMRVFRGSVHVGKNTWKGWGVWTALIVLCNGLALVLAIGVPIFNYLIGLTASLFAAWFTYGLAGAFWLHDAWYGYGRDGYAVPERTVDEEARDGLEARPSVESRWSDRSLGGVQALVRNKGQFALSSATFVAGTFICVAGTYVSVKGIVEEYKSGGVAAPFKC